MVSALRADRCPTDILCKCSLNEQTFTIMVVFFYSLQFFL